MRVRDFWHGVGTHLTVAVLVLLGGVLVWVAFALVMAPDPSPWPILAGVWFVALVVILGALLLGDQGA